MKKSSQPLKFLAQAEKNKKLRSRVVAAIERGNKVTAEEILQIAKEFGFSFSQSQLQNEAKKVISDKFETKDETGTAAMAKPKPKPKPKPVPKPPDSACAKGCISWSKTYCPPRI